MIKELTKLATHLDSKGYKKEANYLDAVIIKMAEGNCPDGQVWNPQYDKCMQKQAPPQTQAWVRECPEGQRWDYDHQDCFPAPTPAPPEPGYDDPYVIENENRIGEHLPPQVIDESGNLCELVATMIDEKVNLTTEHSETAAQQLQASVDRYNIFMSSRVTKEHLERGLDRHERQLLGNKMDKDIRSMFGLPGKYEELSADKPIRILAVVGGMELMRNDIKNMALWWRKYADKKWFGKDYQYAIAETIDAWWKKSAEVYCAAQNYLRVTNTHGEEIAQNTGEAAQSTAASNRANQVTKLASIWPDKTIKRT